jgi:hypothetical protein
MTDCTVNNNETLARGGGIDASASAHVELNRCTISYNKANQGGGIRVLGTMDATNSTFSNNHADFTGGGILNVGTTHLGSCTVAFNTAYDVGGGVNNYSGNVSIWNTIIALNEATSDGDDLYGQVKWEVKNLLGTGDGATVYDEPYNAMIGDDVSPIDPELDATLASNGALTRTHALLYGSPAIDAGSTATPGGGALFACEDEDQRKFLRATDGDYDGDAVCDLGAYEYNSSLPPSDGGGGIDDKVTSSGSSSGCLPGYYGGLAVALADDFANLTHQVQAVEWTGGFETLTTIEREQCGTRYALADPDTLAVMTQKTTTGTDGLASKTREASTLSLASSDSRSLMTRSANAVAAPEAGDVSAPAVEFRRGDTDGSGALGLNDAIAILFWQFAGGDEPGCLDAADADDDGTLGVGDPFAILDRLFLDGSPLPAPGSASCGPDATADGLGCANPGGLCAE